MAIEDFYRTFTAERITVAGSGWSETQVYAGIGSFRGFLQESSKAMVDANGVPLEQKSMILFVPVDSTLRKGDKINYTNVKYMIDAVGTADGISGVGHHKELIVSRWDG